jgi:hypothetical protein
MASEPRTDRDGPFLQAAMFCERIIEEKDGVLSGIRIVDRVIQSAVGTGTPTEMPPLSISLALLIILKSGAARGRSDVNVTVEEPSGFRRTIAEALTVMMEGDDRGANLILRLEWQARQEGLYWFDVAVDGVRLTRVPLRIVYQRQETGQAQNRQPEG